MNNRLQQFLELENLTPAKLADTLGIQRSGLSHILSGRNKPSYDFIYRFLDRFPHINSEWLIKGNGKPYKELEQIKNIAPSLPSSQNDRPNSKSNIPYNSIQYDSLQYNAISNNGLQYSDSPILDDFFDTDTEQPAAVHTENAPQQPYNDVVTPNLNTSEPSENRPDTANCTNGGKKKKIKRVIVFYNDGSFEELFPHIR